MATLHYAAGGTVDGQGYAPAQAGFNLADITYADQLNQLPDGVKGLVWLNQYNGVTQEFIDAVTPFLNNPKVYGFYLVDEPDPTGQWGPQASAADLKAESDWIHSHMPDAKTFVMLMNEGSAEDPHYSNTYSPENTHVDLFGIDWYPFWTDRTLDFNSIDKYVAAAQNIGISTDQIVPTYQTFGGGGWLTESGSHHAMPTAEQEQALLDHWASVVPNPAFDYAYAWGSQNGDVALEDSAALQQVFLQHNTSQSSTPVPPVDNTDTPPVVETGGSTPPVDNTDAPPVVEAGGSTPPQDVDTGGSTPPVVEAGGSAPPAGGTSGGTTIDPIDPTPVSNDGDSWHPGRGFGHGLDFSQLLGSRGGHSWAASSQPDDGGGFSWNGFGSFGGRSGLSWDGSFGRHHDTSDTTDASATTEANTGSSFHFAQSALLDSIGGRHGMNQDHQWHW